MCGIAGLVLWDEAPESWGYTLPGTLRRMSQALAHRGPDDEGFLLATSQRSETAWGPDTPAASRQPLFPWSASQDVDSTQGPFQLAMLHRRLSILDLSPAGHQPMSYAEGRYWLSFNGEIYNYRELRSELQTLGHSFRTQTDTEVLLAAWQRWGPQCLPRLNGMWAFALWDRQQQALYLVRDRFGVKPLYYYLDEFALVFASDTAAIRASGMARLTENETAVTDYLVANQVENRPRGWYKEVVELWPGSYVQIDFQCQCASPVDWYRLPVNTEWDTFRPAEVAEASEQIRGHLEEALSLRLRADVPIGFCLSGGLDSSTIVGAAATVLQKQGVHTRLKAVTALNHSPETDEKDWAEQVVRRYGMDWHLADCLPTGLWEEIRSIIRYQDSPLVGASSYAQYRIMQEAKAQGITILIDGQGGDEVFAGYAPYYRAWLRERKKGGDWAAWAELWKYRKQASTTWSWLLRQEVKERIHWRADNRPWVKDYLYGSVSVPEAPVFDTLNEALAHDMKGPYLKSLLRWEDRNSMAHSIESRTPLADHHPLIEYVYSLPGAWKIHEGASKYLLREAAKPWLPEPIYRRSSKLGLAVPQVRWMKTLQSLIREDIDQLGPQQDRIKTASLLADWDRIWQRGQENELAFVWRVWNYLLWQQVREGRPQVVKGRLP